MDESGKKMLKSLSLDDLRRLKRDVDAEIITRLQTEINEFGNM